MIPSLPKVSVIIPVLNGMPFLAATLSSLELQSFQDFEVLVWDNGSTDGTLDLLHQWLPGRIRGKVIKGTPLSLEQSLARLVESASAPYLARLDADDLATPDRLKNQVHFLDLHPEVVAVGGQMETIDENGVLIGRVKMPLKFYGFLSALLYSCPIPHPGVMFRRDSVLKVGNYMVTKPVEDLELWVRLAAVGEIVNLPEVVLQYRIRTGSVTETAKKAGNHAAILLGCLQNNLPKLFPTDAATLGRLYQRKQTLAVVPLLRIARYIAGRAGVSLSTVLRSPEFLYSARCLTADKDVFSKLIYFWFGREQSVSLTRQILVKVTFLPGVRQIFRSFVKWGEMWKRRRWLKRQMRRGCLIEGIDFRGRPDWDKFMDIGKRVVLEKEVTLAFDPDPNTRGYLRIGDEVFIGRNSFLSIYAPIEIGAKTLIGAYSYVASNNHAFGTRAMAIKDQGYTLGPVKIGAGAWLGTQVIILPNVTIGEGAIIGAGSVVTKSVGAYEIWGGVPARKIGDRP